MSLNAAGIRKREYAAKLLSLFEEYTQALIINVDNVGSRQLQEVRMALRGRGEVLMGKNTVIRKVLREHEREDLQNLVSIVQGNIGFVFTNENLVEIREVVQSNKVPAAARTGLIAPCDVVIPAGPTGLDPGQTTFFQALNIATKIARGSIELVNPVQLVTEGEKVSASAVALLSKMGLKPFFFGISCPYVFDNGSLYSADVLDLTEDVLTSKFIRAVNYITSFSLATGYPTLSAVPHILSHAFTHCVAISIETDYTFEEAKKWKDILSDPEALAAAQAAAAAASSASSGAAAAEPEPEPEESSSEEEDDDFDLFG